MLELISSLDIAFTLVYAPRKGVWNPSGAQSAERFTLLHLDATSTWLPVTHGIAPAESNMFQSERMMGIKEWVSGFMSVVKDPV